MFRRFVVSYCFLTLVLQKYKKPTLPNMVARELISDSVPTIKPTDNGEDALILMEEFKITHLPVVDNGALLGLISEADIFELKQPEAPFGNHNLSLQSPFVLEQSHLYDVAELMTRLNLTVVPVVHQSEAEYVGSILHTRVAHELANFFALHGPGGIISLQMKEVNYSMFEIARIVEDSGARILSSSVKVEPESRFYQVTIKLNLEDISSVIKAFERYGYHVESYYMNSGMLDTIMQERFDSLIRYLDT